MPPGVVCQGFQLGKIIIHIVIRDVVGVHDLTDGVADLAKQNLVSGHVGIVLVYIEKEELALVLVSHVAERHARHDIVIVDEAETATAESLVEAAGKFPVAYTRLPVSI